MYTYRIIYCCSWPCHYQLYLNLRIGVFEARNNTWILYQRILHLFENRHRDQLCLLPEVFSKILEMWLVVGPDAWRLRGSSSITYANRKGTQLRLSAGVTCMRQRGDFQWWQAMTPFLMIVIVFLSRHQIHNEWCNMMQWCQVWFSKTIFALESVGIGPSMLRCPVQNSKTYGYAIRSVSLIVFQGWSFC